MNGGVNFMKLPRIYTHFNQGQVFTIEEASSKLGTSGNTLRKRLSDLAMRGYISPIRQGLYRLSKLDETRLKQSVNCPLEIVSKLTANSYIGYQTALQFHACQNIPANEHIYVISQSKFNCFKFDTRLFMWCQSSETYGIETHTLSAENHSYEIRTTNLEKTLLDCLKRPSYCNNFETLLALCSKIQTPPNLEQLMFYANRIKIRSVYNRMGYLLEAQKDQWNVPESIFKILEDKMSQKQIDWNVIAKNSANNKWKINFLHSNYSSHTS